MISEEKTMKKETGKISSIICEICGKEFFGKWQDGERACGPCKQRVDERQKRTPPVKKANYGLPPRCYR